MSTGSGGTWCKLALGAFIAVAGPNGAALAQNLDAGSGLDRSSTKAVSIQRARPDPGAGRLGTDQATPGVAIGDLTGSHPASGRRVELIHLPTFGAAGLIDKAGGSIRLAGVAATAVDAQCGAGLDAWPCGQIARASLQRFVRRRSVACRMPEAAGPAAGVAHCSVGGSDIGEWLVTQGWAKADGPDYATAEKTARQEKRGVWSPVRPGFAAGPLFEVGPALANAAVRAEVDLSAQSMTLVHRGRVVGQWPVSTARDGKETPTGVWTAKWLSRNHRSRLYDNAPMPWSVFYDGDYAVHGTYHTGRLGRPASNGCVRLDPRHAAVLFNLVREEGLDNTLIVIRY